MKFHKVDDHFHNAMSEIQSLKNLMEINSIWWEAFQSSYRINVTHIHRNWADGGLTQITIVNVVISSVV